MSGASCRSCFVKEEATLITVDGRWRMKVKIEVSKMISFKRRRCADRFLTPTQCPVPARASRRVVPIAAFIDHNFSIPHDLLQLGSPHNLLGATCVRRAPPERVARSWPHFRPERAAIEPSPRNRSHYNPNRGRPAAPAHHRCTHISRRKDESRLAGHGGGFRVPGFNLSSSRRASSTTVSIF